MVHRELFGHCVITHIKCPHAHISSISLPHSTHTLYIMLAFLQSLVQEFIRYCQGVVACIIATCMYTWMWPFLIEVAVVVVEEARSSVVQEAARYIFFFHVIFLLMIFRANARLISITNKSCAAFFAADFPHLQLMLVHLAVALRWFLLLGLIKSLLEKAVSPSISLLAQNFC
jgi:hypothetical protein